MNKYYTPNLKEFHIGFEYEEYLKSKGEWNWECQKVEEVYEFTYYKDQINANNIRVKYLDKEDIESLGWEIDQKTKDGYFFVIGNIMDGDYMLNTKDFKKIYIYPIIGTHNQIEFKGTIKNKSELKKLLKQLNIL